MKVGVRCLVVGMVVLLAWPGLAAKKSKKKSQQKKAKATATATPTPAATPTPTPTPRQGTRLWDAARAGMTEEELLQDFQGKADPSAKRAVSEEGTYVGATMREAKIGDSSFGVEFIFRSADRKLERVTLACTECYGGEFGRVRRTLIEAYGPPLLDEAPSVDRRRTVWVADGVRIQLRWVFTDLLGGAIRVLSVHFVEAARPEPGNPQALAP